MGRISHRGIRSIGYLAIVCVIALSQQCLRGRAAAQSLAPAALSPVIATSPTAIASPAAIGSPAAAPAAAPAIVSTSAPVNAVAQTIAKTPAAAVTTPIAAASAAAPAEKVAAAIIPAPAPQPSAIAVAPATPVTPAGSAASAVSGTGLQTAALIAPGKHEDPTAAGQQLFDQTPYDSRDDPVSWSLHIYKSRHRTEVFFKGRLFRIYHAVFGRSRQSGAKLWEGDSRTPEGAYLITEKRRSARFRWFLKLNYPNATDQAHFAALRSAREISAGAREGGQVGIHGTDSPYLNVSDVNWTLGCISLSNEDIAEMATLLPVGTLVVINP